MRYFPATSYPARIEIGEPPRPIRRKAAAAPLQSRRGYWFTLGLFSGLTLAGYVAGLWPLLAR